MPRSGFMEVIMKRDDNNSTFNFDEDPEFSKKFNDNLDKVLNDEETNSEKSPMEDELSKDKKSMTPGITDNITDTKDTNEIIDTKDTVNMEEVASPDHSDEVMNADINADMETAAAKMQMAFDESDEVHDELNEIKKSLANQVNDVITSKETKKKGKSKFKKVLIGLLIAAISISGILSFLIWTEPGNQVLLKLGVNIGSQIWVMATKDFEDEEKNIPPVVEDTDNIEKEDLESDAPEIDPVDIKWPEHPGNGVHVDGIYNILLIGEEAIGSDDGKGRTDSIVIATLDTIGKKVKLTSIMRDCFVQIPGYQDNKINSAYEKGGVSLLYKTIENNFDIHLDGCAKVNFKNFEKIVNMLGGLDITLTEDEAHYLNTTNYISKRQYRNVKAGKNHLNGNQVLGYTRVRKRATITGNNNDYGRTDRHRIVLNAIFEKYKTKNKVELATVMFRLLPMITSDIDSKCFEHMLNSFILMGTPKIDQLRIPANGTFKDNLKVRGMSVLILDLDANIKVIHNFVFGDNIIHSDNNLTEPSVTGSVKKTDSSKSQSLK